MKTQSRSATCSLFGKIEYPTIDRVYREMTELRKNTPTLPVDLIISSGGGIIDVGFALVDLLTLFQRRGLILTSVGVSAVGSMAIPVFMSAGRRIITPHTSFFFHELGYTTDGERITTRESGFRTGSLRKDEEWYSEIIAKQSGKISAREVRKLMKKTSNLYPDQIIRYGLAHEIIE